MNVDAEGVPVGKSPTKGAPPGTRRESLDGADDDTEASGKSHQELRDQEHGDQDTRLERRESLDTEFRRKANHTAYWHAEATDQLSVVGFDSFNKRGPRGAGRPPVAR